MYYHLVMPLFKGTDKVNSLPQEEGYIEEGRSHIHTPHLIHLFNKIFIEFLFVVRQEETLIEGFMSENNEKWEKCGRCICMNAFIQ